MDASTRLVWRNRLTVDALLGHVELKNEVRVECPGSGQSALVVSKRSPAEVALKLSRSGVGQLIRNSAPFRKMWI
jgi:formate dehydrogenase assembly factor FdhD